MPHDASGASMTPIFSCKLMADTLLLGDMWGRSRNSLCYKELRCLQPKSVQLIRTVPNSQNSLRLPPK